MNALQGNLDQLKKVIDSGKVHVDYKDKVPNFTLVLPNLGHFHKEQHKYIRNSFWFANFVKSGFVTFPLVSLVRCGT